MPVPSEGNVSGGSYPSIAFGARVFLVLYFYALKDDLDLDEEVEERR